MLSPDPLHPSSRTTRLLALTLLCSALAASGCGKTSKTDGPVDVGLTGSLIVLHAGSLSVPLRELSELFMKRHPGVTVKAEAAGSRDTARKVSDLGRACDVLGSADYRVVDNLLLPEHASFNIRFATNEMAIAYTGQSEGQGELSATSWIDVLQREEVTFGRADPNRDPCGYRTMMLFLLAESHYQRPGLAEALAAKHGQKYIRPKETDLLALLEAGELDYLFIYRSVAVQHRLLVLELPEAINLRSPELAEQYAQVKVKVTGRKPGETLTLEGTPINYSVTIPTKAPNRPAAEAYVALLLSPEGQALMKRNGQTPIMPARPDRIDRVPPALQRWCRAPDGT